MEREPTATATPLSMKRPKSNAQTCGDAARADLSQRKGASSFRPVSACRRQSSAGRLPTRVTSNVRARHGCSTRARGSCGALLRVNTLFTCPRRPPLVVRVTRPCARPAPQRTCRKCGACTLSENDQMDSRVDRWAAIRWLRHADDRRRRFRLSRPVAVPGDIGLELLENALAIGAGLFAIINIVGPVSGSHLNPIVSLVDAWFGACS